MEHLSVSIPVSKTGRPSTALRASEARYRRLFETAQDGILILNGQSGLITDVNPFLVQLLSYDREEFIGKKLWNFGPFKNVEASKIVFNELQNKGYVRYENLPLETKDGRSVSVEFVSNVYGVNGESVIQCNIRDITARRYTQKVDERLRQSQKMEAVGQLAGGIAHDFNNLLTVVLGYCEMLERHIETDEAGLKMVERIRNAGTLATRLTRQLLAFSRRQVMRPVVLDLNKLVIETQAMLQRLIGDHIDIATELLPDLGRVEADPTQIEQILMNLALNSRDAMPNGGTITITTANVEWQGGNSLTRPEMEHGPYVMLAVSDVGIGIKKDVQAHIFEPFFTTKRAGHGTGLGLSTVYGVVKQSGGYIYVRSEEGHGATFEVYLPRVAGEHDEHKAAEMAPGKGGHETILLVEDNEPLMELAREMLEGLGYTVLTSIRPSEAVGIAKHYKGQIELLITDVVMPEISGRVLADKMSAIRPEMKVLYISGYPDGHVAENFELKDGWSLLEKPFTRNGMAKRIREVLDAGQN